MYSRKLVFDFFHLSFLIIFAITKADLQYYQNCSSSKTFTPNSAYESNLNTLLSCLSTAATGSNEFYNTTAGGQNKDDTVYGFFICRGDMTQEECQRCVKNATQEIASRCRYSKEAIIWYNNECVVRYSNHSLFSTLDLWPRVILLNITNSSRSNQETFSWVLANTLNEAVDEASNSAKSSGTKKIAAKAANLSEFQALYVLTQCTPDLSSQDCNRCLRDMIGVIPLCCLGRAGGIILYPSCFYRFELYKFYSDLAITHTPPTTAESGPRPRGERKNGSRRRTISMVVIPIVVLLILFIFGCHFLRRKKRKSYKTILRENFGDESTTLESLQFDFATIEVATNKFSYENWIGKGGFGEVYKGILSDGREIAVKRLSRSSGQGVAEFKNEVLLVAKLQHRNLVALIGFCLQEQEKLLIYEFLPNKSLDYFLFDSQKHRLLNWIERYKIIAGSAQAIHYLHEHSRLKIIHRDLKPSNILLDNNMNPKISDFGIARTVSIDQEPGKTNRIVGTYGYMSPEYAMLGKFSEKSDVFSFGVIILEIISGKRNANSYGLHHVDGLTYAWKQWNDNTPLEILDSNLKESYFELEVIKCIQIGLLCVQENPDDRPLMARVVSYLTNLSLELPFPNKPPFFIHDRVELNMVAVESGSGLSNNNSISSINEMSTSTFFPR